MKIINRFTGAEVGEFEIKSRADLSGANLSWADLSGADLSGAHLSGADLRGANLSWAHLSGANLSGAHLSGADLSGADLRGADLGWAHLSGANLSGAKGLTSPAEWLDENFEHDEAGLIVYKTFGSNYLPPDDWTLEPGNFITEIASPDRCTDCGSGINVATRAWIESNNQYIRLWKCRIAWIDLAAAVVPYNTDGKFRCERLELLEIVK